MASSLAPLASVPAARAALPPPPVADADTDDAEESQCSWAALRAALLPPDGALPAAPFDGAFGLLVSGAVFGGWVKQASPACAAASVAGAWNALACGGRHGRGALRQRDVVDAMARASRRSVDAKRARFERLLGAERFADFERAVDDAIAADPSGKTLGGESKAAPGMRRAEVMRVVVRVAETVGGPELDADSDSNSDSVSDLPPERAPRRSAFAAIAALAREDAARARGRSGGGAEGDEEEDEDDAADDDEEEDAAAAEKEKNSGGVRAVEKENDDDAALVAALAAGVDATGPTAGMKAKKKKTSRKGGPPARFLARMAAREEKIKESRISDAAGESAPAGETVKEPSSEPSSEPKSSEPKSSEPSSEPKKPASDPSRWRWRDDLWAVFKARAGLEKLLRAKPSTAAFGNAGVAEALRNASEIAAEKELREKENTQKAAGGEGAEGTAEAMARGSLGSRAADGSASDLAAAADGGVSDDEKASREKALASSFPRLACRVAVGKRTKHRRDLDVVISAAGDQRAAAAREWEGLRALFAREGTALLSHHRNHYALVFALREWGGRREMLTARRGQRPSAWIDWEEARGTMLGWTGYAILAVEAER